MSFCNDCGVDQRVEPCRCDKPETTDAAQQHMTWNTIINPMVYVAMMDGKDTTGLCTVREAVAAMREVGQDIMEMWFLGEDDKKINVEIKITSVVEKDA